MRFYSAVESYDRAVNNLESRVLVSARRLKDLPIELSEKEISYNWIPDLTPRESNAPELEVAR